MYDYIELTPTSLEPYKHFLPNKILYEAQHLPEDCLLIAFGALLKDTPVGIGIAKLNYNLDLLDVLHIEVGSKYRNQHIGRTLLAQIQDKALSKGAKIFTLVYPQETPETPAIEKIIAANHWKGTRDFLVRALFDTAAFNSPLLASDSKLPDEFREILWKDLTPEQTRDLHYREEQGHFPHVISPFQDEPIETSISLGLELDGRIVGWSVAHRIDADTVRYSSLYMEPSLKHRGLATKLLVDSWRLHKQSPSKYSLLEVPFLQVHPSWMEFIKKYLLPFAINVNYYKQAWHTI